MNTKTVILIVLVTALATAICSATRGSEEDMPYRQLLRELRKKGTDMRKRFGEAVNVMSKRDDGCDASLKPCLQSSDCTQYTCDGVQFDCYSCPIGQGQCCQPDSSYTYRR